MSYSYNQTRKNERRMKLFSTMDKVHLIEAVKGNRALRNTFFTYIDKINENRNKKNQVTVQDVISEV